jgi:hypothetical protein
MTNFHFIIDRILKCSVPCVLTCGSAVWVRLFKVSTRFRNKRKITRKYSIQVKLYFVFSVNYLKLLRSHFTVLKLVCLLMPCLIDPSTYVINFLSMLLVNEKSLCLINWARRHENVWESGVIAPQFLTSALDGGEWSASRLGRFTSGHLFAANSYSFPEWRPTMHQKRCSLNSWKIHKWTLWVAWGVFLGKVNHF